MIRFTDIFEGQRQLGPYFRYYPRAAKAFGGCKNAILIQAFMFCSGDHGRERGDGWLHFPNGKGQSGLEKVLELTGLSIREFRTSRSSLEAMKVLESRHNPVTREVCFWLNYDVVNRLWERFCKKNQQLEEPAEPIRDRVDVKTTSSRCQNDIHSMRKSFKINDQFGSSTPPPDLFRTKNEKQARQACGSTSSSDQTTIQTPNELQPAKLEPETESSDTKQNLNLFQQVGRAAGAAALGSVDAARERARLKIEAAQAIKRKIEHERQQRRERAGQPMATGQENE